MLNATRAVKYRLFFDCDLLLLLNCLQTPPLCIYWCDIEGEGEEEAQILHH